MTIGDHIDVPADVVVRCPLVKFSLLRAQKCDGCAHFGGLTEMLSGDQHPFHRRFAVNCKHGVDRELQHLTQD